MIQSKLVNIYPAGPLVIFTPPVTSPILSEEHTTGTILHCLQAGARVEEILENGDLVALDFKNYNMENSKAETIKVEVEEKKPVVTETVNEVVEPEAQPAQVAAPEVEAAPEVVTTAQPEEEPKVETVVEVETAEEAPAETAVEAPAEEPAAPASVPSADSKSKNKRG